MSHRMIFPLLSFLLLLIFGCSKDDDKNNDNASSIAWQKVGIFGNERILGLFVNSDSTELHVMTQEYYAYHNLAQGIKDFDLHVLMHQLGYNTLTSTSPDLPYFNDNRCFYCDSTGSSMYVYAIGNDDWTPLGELNVNELMPDTTGYTTHFASSYGCNHPNHIVHIESNRYYVTVERHKNSSRGNFNAEYRQFLLRTTFDYPVQYSIGYAVTPQTQISTDTHIVSTHAVNGLFIQECYADTDKPVHIILSPTSFHLITGTGRYPLRDIFASYDGRLLLGLGDGIIMSSLDQGLDWTEFAYINGPWSYANINHRHILYYVNHIASWNNDVSLLASDFEMLDHTGLGTAKIHYLVQFGDYVYAGTNEGLFVKPLKDFFTTAEDRQNSHIMPIDIRR